MFSFSALILNKRQQRLNPELAETLMRVSHDRRTPRRIGKEAAVDFLWVSKVSDG